MQCLSGKVKDYHIYVDVIILPYITIPVTEDTGIVKPNFEVQKKCKALVDTGATHTCIHPNIVQELKISILNRYEIRHLEGNIDARTCGFFISASTSSLAEKNCVFAEGAEVDISNIGDDLDVIIGMETIIKGSLKTEKGGNFEFCL